jgi:hypothetical protein
VSAGGSRGAVKAWSWPGRKLASWPEMLGELLPLPMNARNDAPAALHAAPGPR